MDEVDPAALEAARAYEARFVPVLFGPWAPRMVAAASLREGERVLDVGSGTGVLAREALHAVGRDGAVVGLDPDPAMLAVAAEVEPGARWERGTAETLPFDAGSFDVVMSQFALMFFRDPDRGLREMHRVLKPGGRLAVAVWDALERTPAYAKSVQVLEAVAGRAAADALRAPFVLGDPDALAAMVSGTGFEGVRVETLTREARFPSVRAMVEGDLRGWLPVLGVHLDEPTIARVLAEAETALATYVQPDGGMRFATPAHLLTASVPAGTHGTESPMG